MKKLLSLLLAALTCFGVLAFSSGSAPDPENDWENIQSMYKQGTVEHEIYNKLKDMVEEDKIRAVKNAKQAGRRIKE